MIPSLETRPSQAAYNEEANIASLLRGITEACRDAGTAFSVVVVKDGSMDRTRESRWWCITTHAI